MLRTSGVRLLDDRDVREVLDLLARDPVANVFVASRVEAAGLSSWRLGADLWGVGERGRLEAVCYSGANLVLAEAGPGAARAFAERARRQGRRCSSVVGVAEAVEVLWAVLRPSWGPARDVRTQPLLAIDGPPAHPPDPAVRRVRRDEVELLLPACVAMFTEEVGVSPLLGDGGALYRTRVEELVSQGRAYARIEDGRVLFKGEVGAATSAVSQVQGVWVDPALRGRGVGTAGMAALVEQAQRDFAPVVSLYVNDYNTGARRSYDKVGFREVGTLTSVLF